MCNSLCTSHGRGRVPAKASWPPDGEKATVWIHPRFRSNLESSSPHLPPPSPNIASFSALYIEHVLYACIVTRVWFMVGGELVDSRQYGGVIPGATVIEV